MYISLKNESLRNVSVNLVNLLFSGVSDWSSTKWLLKIDHIPESLITTILHSIFVSVFALSGTTTAVFNSVEIEFSKSDILHNESYINYFTLQEEGGGLQQSSTHKI